MKTAVILHGTCDSDEYFSDKFPSLSNSHWLPWLQKQFLMHGYLAYTPEMPLAHAPDYGRWKAEFERYPVDESSVLVGHSCGGGFLLRWLSETKRDIARLVLVAPWLDPERRKSGDFFDFAFDPNLARRCDMHLLESSNDSPDIQRSIEVIRKELPAAHHHHMFRDYGHFCFDDMGTEQFPELGDIALRGRCRQ